MRQEVPITTCRELLGLYKPDQQEQQIIQVLRVNFQEYEELQGSGQRLIRSFSERAQNSAGCQPEDSFEPFIFGWIALNSWASCVTGSESDTPYLNALMLDSELNRRFDDLFKEAELRSLLEQFRGFWPILRPLPQNRMPAQAATRQELVLRELQSPRSNSRFRPACASRHYMSGKKIPMDWPHTLSAIYQVRCNLFHGSKSLHSDFDTQIVFHSFRVLVRVLRMLGL